MRRFGRLSGVTLIIIGAALLLAGVGATVVHASMRGKSHPAVRTVAQGATDPPQTAQQPQPPPGATPQVLPPESALPAVSFTADDGSTQQLFVTIADTLAEQNNGLMNVTAMPDDEGEIFIFDGDTQTPFWMKDTLIPLSVAFIRDDGTIVDIQEMQAESLDFHVPAAPYRYAIEANAGWYADHDIQIGDSADVSAAYAASPVYGHPNAAPSMGQ